MSENFDEAVARFREFLGKVGLPEQIIWLSPADAVLTRRRVLYIKSLPPEIGLALAREKYDIGMAAKLGVLFAALCKLENATCCFVWFPSDADEARRSLMLSSGGLKMRAPTEKLRLRIKRVRNPIRWKILQIWHREKSDWLDFLFS